MSRITPVEWLDHPLGITIPLHPSKRDNIREHAIRVRVRQSMSGILVHQ
jgi:hypothetical protein